MAGKKKEPKVEVTTEEKKGPVYKAFSVERDSTDPQLWKMITYEMQDGKVISRSEKQAEGKAMAIERFQLAFVETFFWGK